MSNRRFLLDEGPSPQLNLAKTELIVVSANPSFHHNFTFQLGSSTITPSKTARNSQKPWSCDDKLNFSDYITKTARSCRFALYNIKKIRPFLSEHATQLLVQALVLSRLDYCNALLAGLPASSIKPLQLIQNAAARLIFNEPKRTHVTPLFINLHWLPIAARIKFKALLFAYRTTSGSAPLYLNSLLHYLIITKGVPQGSVLGPLLFILYINNIDSNVSKGKFHFYADDTVLYFSAPTADQALSQLQLDFNTLQQNLYDLKLILNAEKTSHAFLQILTSQGTKIESVSKYRYFGILIDESLSFTFHIQQLAKRLQLKLGFYFRIKSFLLFESRKRLVAATFMSILGLLYQCRDLNTGISSYTRLF